MLDLGPVTLRLRSDIPAVWEGLTRVYRDFPVLAPDRFADVSMELRHGAGVRRFVRKQAQLLVDDQPLFYPVALSLAPVLLEWGMNWVVALREHEYLLVHASAVEREGKAALLPALPGSGKSTLAGLLSMSGWRLLSDEFGMLELSSGKLRPFPRPFSLKGTSIAAVRAVAPRMETTETYEHPEDGPMVLVRPVGDAVARRDARAEPRWIVFPTYKADAALSVTPIAKTDAFFEVQDDTFNYFMLREAGFEALASLVERCRCMRLTYGRTEDALGFFERLLAEDRVP